MLTCCVQYCDEWGYLMIGLAACVPCWVLPLVLPNKVHCQQQQQLQQHGALCGTVPLLPQCAALPVTSSQHVSAACLPA
jgi:hypothetical protein